ncbi:vancomycin permeability regulator SanA [Natronobacillus azotifigens]|uniref:YdcF family protein n=1 Tax=Natronobacillus azotifigens TaxID=472978 RepID=A0A9J6RHF1_9BACI|nr:YdcF family protein [Natronobacillus azotifigens]MCZ0704553.1 YdcF family protein [Natronobacillus azotifigens]
MKRKSLIKFGLLLLIGLLLWFTIHTIVIVTDGLHDELAKVDIAVVLGNKVELDGQPSNRLQARLDKARELYEEGYFEHIVVSGGVGEEGFDEAKVMKEYLVNRGIPSEVIFEDSYGYNSYMTAENTRAIMKDLNFESVMVISQYFHISRTKLTFRKLGFEEVYSAHAEIFEVRDFYSIIREFPAYYKYLFK